MRKYLPFLFILVTVFVFFWQFLIKGLIPIPADTIVGLYHPYRDLYVDEYPRGVPFKNFLITDPVRQQYPWKKLSTDQIRNGKVPSWNPYSFTGTPLAANFQSSPYYPLNIIFLIPPFDSSWGIFILLSPLLAAFFMYAFLRNRKLEDIPSMLGAIVFAFGGFFATWLEWGNILHTTLWLPLILLAIDKSFEGKNRLWQVVIILSLSSSFLAGHLQTFFYLFVLSIFYLLFKLLESRKVKSLVPVLISIGLFLVLVSFQIIPVLNFILSSAREADGANWHSAGWFIPVGHLVQFFIPDFFGNPATLNYWGEWNYGELVGYVGIIPLLLALFAFSKKNKNVFFWGITIFICLVLATSNVISKLPFQFGVPFISTAQPTRLLFIVDFAIAVLSSYGLNILFKENFKKIYLIPVFIVGIILGSAFLITFLGQSLNLDPTNLMVAKRNSLLPISLFVLSVFLIGLSIKVKPKFKEIALALLIVLTLLDLFRFSWKFNPFVNRNYLFPMTESIAFIKENVGNYRIMSTDPRILPPNFNVIYGIQSVEGYDPLYIKSYGELVAAINRNGPDTSAPFNFNRIVRPENYSSSLIDLLGVKYVLSLTDLDSPKLELVFNEGETKVYENKEVASRAFFVDSVAFSRSKDKIISLMMKKDFDPKTKAIVEDSFFSTPLGSGSAKIVNYSENKIVIETNNSKGGFLVLTDSYYPSWHARIGKSGSELKEAKIYKTDYAFRGVVVPPGIVKIEFYNKSL